MAVSTKKQLLIVGTAAFAIVVISTLGTFRSSQEVAARTFLLDVTKSFKAELPEAISFVTTELERTEEACTINIIAITSDKPMIIQQGYVIPEDRSPFKETFYAAKEKLILDWKLAAEEKLKPEGDRSNVFLALWYAALLLEKSNGPKELLVLSDLRHVTKDLDIESVQQVNVDSTLEWVKREGLFPDLRGVRVRFFGVHVQGKSGPGRYFAGLKELYRRYVTEAGGEFADFRPDFSVDLNSLKR